MQFCENLFDVFPVESDARNLRRDLMSLHQRRRFRRHAIENRSVLRSVLTLACGSLLFSLDCFPVSQYFGRIAGGCIAENMWMASHHLGVHLIDDVVNIEFAAFLSHARKEGDLKKEIAE